MCFRYVSDRTQKLDHKNCLLLLHNVEQGSNMSDCENESFI